MRISRRQLLKLAAAGGPLWVAGRLLGASVAPQPAVAPALPQFVDVTAKSGINFRHSFGEKELSSILEGTGSGCAWFDYNNDGDRRYGRRL
jgi:hypothetical protein